MSTCVESSAACWQLAQATFPHRKGSDSSCEAFVSGCGLGGSLRGMQVITGQGGCSDYD